MSEVNREPVLRAQGIEGYDQCWYPLALASEVRREQVSGHAFLGGKVVAYRTGDGEVQVLSAYCRHLGADLSQGCIVEGRLRCPFHHWQYDTDGRCVKVPSGDEIPSQARLFRFHAQESMGLVWVFNGVEPTYEVPHFDCDEDGLVVRAFRNPHVLPVDPQLLFLNAFDLQHFEVVHGFHIDAEQTRIERDGQTLRYHFHAEVPGLGKLEQQRRIWGTNSVTIASVFQGRRLFMSHALLAMPGNRCCGFIVNATPKDPDDGDATAIDTLLAEAEAYAMRLIEEDLPIMQDLRFRRPMLTASDRLLAQGIKWVRTFPRDDTAQDYIA